MLGSEGVYAAKKRKKPVQKILKVPPVDGTVKTNPSKRHRDRLNGELERLTSLLPFSQEVRGRLDKLSVLRLSVGYLKVKSYFRATLQKSEWTAPSLTGNCRNGQTTSIDRVSFSERDFLLQALNGFVLVVTTDGSIFYTSPTIQDHLGFHESDVLHQSVYELIHMDDRHLFRCQLHFALNPNQAEADATRDGDAEITPAVNYLPQHLPPENSSFLERSFCCRFRCLLDNSSGFLALNFQGRLKYLDGHGRTGDDGTAVPRRLALFAIATPMQPPSVMEIRTKTLIFQTKHRLDFAPMGMDTRGKVVLGYSETELITKGSGYQFIHAADMMYCADNHLRMMKTGDSGFTFFRLLNKTGVWVWVQANARLVFKDGRPDFIIARQKALTNEEGEEHLRQRRIQLPFNFATGEAFLYESFPSLDSSVPPASSPPGPRQSPVKKPLDPASLLGSFLRQDHSVYTQPQEPTPLAPACPLPPDQDPTPLAPACPPPPDQDPTPLDPLLSLERAFLDSHALLSVPGESQASPRQRHEDPTAQAMLDSLEQILGEMAGGGLEGLEVGDGELRGWESALLRVNMEREGISREQSEMLANDVFSYVEEALRKETDASGRLISSEQNAIIDPIDGLSARLPSNENAAAVFPHNLPSTESDHLQGSALPGNQGYGLNSSSSETQWQVVTDINSNLSSLGEQSLLRSGVPTHLNCSPGDAARQRPWAPGRISGFPHGNQMVPPLSRNCDQSHPGPLGQPWTPSIPNTNHNHNHTPQPNVIHNLPVTVDQTVQQSLVHSGCGLTNRQILGRSYSPQSWQQTSWQPQQQLPQGFLNGVAFGRQDSAQRSRPSQAPPSLSDACPGARPLTHTLRTPSDSCMFERRGLPPSKIPTAASTSNLAWPDGPILSPPRSNGPPPSSVHTAPPRAPPCVHRPSQTGLPAWPAALHQGMQQLTGSLTSPWPAPYTAGGNGSGIEPSEGTSSLGQGEARCSLLSYPPGNGSIQASYFYLNGEAQIPNAASNDHVDPSTFPR